MKKTISVHYWALAILLCSAFLFSACQKDDKTGPEVTPQEDEITINVRNWAF